MEAAAASVPTIAFNVAGVRDSVANGISGYLAAGEQDFVTQWISLASNEDRRREMSIAARTRAAAFTWDRAIDMFETALTTTVRGR
jgi:glycosyltransferase involved in cell wall biosynthesis